MRNLLVTSLALLILGSLGFAQMAPTVSDAANWDTWIADADAIAAMVEAPSDAERDAELLELIMLAESRNADTQVIVDYWNAASPPYRWIEVVNDAYRGGPPNPLAGRAFALLNVAMYDATISTWKAKYANGTMGAASPASYDETLDILVPTGQHPSFPSEHAAVATAAAEILAYVKPDNAETYRALAEEAMRSRLLAGANFQSDIDAGKLIGQAVAEEIIAWASADGSDAPWEFTAPENTLFAVAEPVFPVTGSWKTMALESGSQFRAPEPPAYDSERVQADLEEIKSHVGSVPAIQQATYWGTFDSAMKVWYDFANTLLFEARHADNAPYMALVYSGIGVAALDATIGCFDSKYAYTYARPVHIDADITPVIPTPPHPSYPSAHSCVSNAQANVFAHFFPHATDKALGMAQAAGQSRIFGGIHYQIDNTAGLELGEKVAGVVIEKLESMTQ